MDAFPTPTPPLEATLPAALPPGFGQPAPPTGFGSQQGPPPPPELAIAQPKKRSKGLIAAIAAVAVVLAGAGVAFGVPSIRHKLLGSEIVGPTIANPANPDLKVNNPLNLGASFVNGHKTAWEFTETDPGVTDVLVLYADQDLVVMGQMVREEHVDAPAYVGLDAKTGREIWRHDAASPDAAEILCGDGLFAGYLVCDQRSDIGLHGVLVDPKTGEAGPSVGFDLPDIPTNSGGGWMAVDETLVVVEYPANGKERVQVVLLSAPGQVAWTQEISLTGNYDAAIRGRHVGELLELTAWGSTAILGWDDGRVVSSSSGWSSAWPGNRIVVQSDGATASVDLANGKTAELISSPRGAMQPLVFMGEVPKTPVVAYDDEVCVLDPDSSEVKWSFGIPSSDLSADWDGGSRVVLHSRSMTWMIDIEEGELLWEAEGPADLCSYCPGPAEISFAADGTVFVRGTQITGENPWEAVALNPESGQQAWSAVDLVGMNSIWPGGPAGTRDALYVSLNDRVQRWDPVKPGEGQDTQAVALPADFPNCPSGMEVVSWTKYADGLLLICGADGKGFTVTVKDQAGTELQATELTFTTDGYQVVCQGGLVIDVSLGGAVVSTTPKVGEPALALASQAWDLRTGEVAFTQPAADIVPCPPGTWPISLSTWEGGWLRICGTGTGQSNQIAYSDAEFGTGQADDASSVDFGYCGTTPEGLEVCAYRAPALVTFAKPGQQGDQRSVGTNFFAGYGQGGSGVGQGAYGAQAPEDTDVDQVRYLVEILNKSAGARSKLGPAVAAVSSCSNVSAQVNTIQSIANNRQELLDALRSTPVDKISGGTVLVQQLTEALEASLGADNAYLDWAKAKLSSNCAAGAGADAFARAEGYDGPATAAKRVFVDNWNANIAPKYGVVTFEESQI
ncbi:MAG: PQQ-binding-like beta-propeller repeat protein [Micrococcales bacterium]|nr:PQQ-binding-like beta-propeller repeat protein [Micrococcales bacterium]